MSAKAVLIISLLLLTYQQTYAQTYSVTKGPESTDFGKYKPKEPKSLDELPDPIKTKLVMHLKNRLGDAFYSKLEFSGGQVVDFEELRRVEPESRNYKWKPFAYGLTFNLSEPEKGIKAYHARILLDSDGSIMQEIDLPEIARHPEKAQIISLAEAKEIAAKHKFSLTRARVELSYNSEIDSLVWTLEYKLKGDRYVWVDRVIRIEAQSGKVLSLGNAERFF
jgi:uncharacterized membrane protein YkoI